MEIREYLFNLTKIFGKKNRVKKLPVAILTPTRSESTDQMG